MGLSLVYTMVIINIKMAIVFKTFKYRLYPNKEQKVFLEKHFGGCRFVYNYFLALRSEKYKTEKKNVSGFECERMLPSLKKEFSWLKEINSQSLQQAVLNLERAFQGFFKKLGGYPCFKKKKGRQSFLVPQHFRIENNKLFIPKLKSGIKIKPHRFPEGTPKTLTISKEPSGKYYASITCEVEIEPLPKRDSEVGIDLGLEHFATLSTGEKVDYPRFLLKSERKLRSLHRWLSRKKKGSHNREKARLRVARLYEKTRNQRVDFLHKLSKRLISENQAIYLEDLNVKGMVRNRHLSKAISDSGWGEFVRQLGYKSLWYGRTFRQIPRFYPSSKECSICHFVIPRLELSQRSWVCPNCGTVHDRDLNASVVIKQVGQGLPELTPVEKRASTSVFSMRQVASLKQEA